MRCTLEWLRPIALAILRSDQCVPPRRLFVERHVDDALDRRGVQRGLAPRSGGVPFEPGDAARQIAIPPTISGSLGLASRPNDLRNAGSLRPQQHDPRPPNQFLWRVPARHPARLMQRFEDFAVAGVVFWAISLDFPWAWTRRLGSGLEPEFGAGRVCGLKGRL